MTNKLIPTAILTVIATLGINHQAIAETSTTQATTNQMAPAKGTEKCYGIAKAGQNDCGTAGHMCAGESSVDNDKESWIAVPTGLCKRIVGGSTQSPSKG